VCVCVCVCVCLCVKLEDLVCPFSSTLGVAAVLVQVEH